MTEKKKEQKPQKPIDKLTKNPRSVDTFLARFLDSKYSNV